MSNSTSSERKAVAKVLIVDDHPAVREALAIRIGSQADLEVCGEASDLSEAVELAALTEPDAAVIDISLETSSGIDLIKRLAARNANIRIVVWSMYSEELYAERALRAGAMGYLTKNKGTGQILDAIREVLAGKMYLSTALTLKLLQRTVGQGLQDAGRLPIDTLSNRELDVFRLIGQGLKTQDIAVHLHLSINTVETYRDRIRGKLKLSDGLELSRCAWQWTAEKGS